MTEYYIKTEQDKLTNSVNFKRDQRIHVQHIKKLKCNHALQSYI